MSRPTSDDLRMANATDEKPYRRRSFKTKLMLLVALAVALPALFTCLILGIQLNRQARNLFANGLSANLETFTLVVQDAEKNVSEGLARMASDNTLQVTLDLEIASQLNRYIEAQRQVLGIGFVAVYNAEFPQCCILRHRKERNAGAVAVRGDRRAKRRRLRCRARPDPATGAMRWHGLSRVGTAGPSGPRRQFGRRRPEPGLSTVGIHSRRHAGRKLCVDQRAAEPAHPSSADLGRRRSGLFERRHIKRNYFAPKP